MHQPPDHRFRRIRSAAQKCAPWTGEPEALPLYTYLRTPGNISLSEPLEIALDLYETPEHRETLDAFLLARATDDDIAKTLEMGTDVVRHYKFFFMDTSVFRHKLDWLRYAEMYPGSARGKELVRAGVQQGLDFLKWTFLGDAGVDTKKVIRSAMEDAYFRGKAHRGNKLDSNLTREARAWIGTATANAALLDKIDPPDAKNAIQELRLIIQKQDSTVPLGDSSIDTKEILS